MISFETISAHAIFKYLQEHCEAVTLPVALAQISQIIAAQKAFGLSNEIILEALRTKIFEPCRVEMPVDFSRFAKAIRAKKEIPEAGKEYKLFLNGASVLAECIFVSECQGEPCFAFKQLGDDNPNKGLINALRFRSVVYTEKE